MIANEPQDPIPSQTYPVSGSGEASIFPGMLWIAVITLILYVVCVPFSTLTYEANDPFGDNGSFIETYAYLVTNFHNGLSQEWKHLLGLGQPAQTQRILLNILSPILSTKPHSLMLINFVAFMMAAMVIYYSAIAAGCSRAVGLVCAVIPWGFPHMYGSAPVGPAGYFAFTSLNIDVIFYSAMVAFGAAMSLFAARPWERWRLILLVIAMFAAMLSRQSAFVTGLLALLPGLAVAALVTMRENDRRRSFRAAAYASLMIVLAIVIVSLRFNIMRSYYSASFNSNALGTFNLDNMASSIDDYRFIVDWLVLGRITHQYFLTIVANLVILSALYAVWRFIRNRHSSRENAMVAALALSGASLFYGTFSGGIISGVRASFHSYHGFLPMLIGLSLSSIAIVHLVLRTWRPSAKISLLACASISAAFIANAHWMEKTLANTVQTGARPSDIRSFAVKLELDRFDRKIAWLWYGHINRSVINYHRAQAGLSRIAEMPMPENVTVAIWTGGTEELDVALERYGSGLDYIFEHAEYLVIPEHPILYHLDPGPYPFRRYPEVLIRKLNASGGPRLRVCKRLRTARSGVPYYMLLTQIIRDGNKPCSMEALPLPYGRTIPREDIRLKTLPIKGIGLLENKANNYRIRLHDNSGRQRDYEVPKNFFVPDLFSQTLVDEFPEIMEIIKR